jgi:HEAT repeat protein
LVQALSTSGSAEVAFEVAKKLIGRELELGELVQLQAIASAPRKRYFVRSAAISVLGLRGARFASERLIRLMERQRESISVREFAAEALGNLRAVEALDALCEVANTTKSKRLARSALYALSEIGGEIATSCLREVSTRHQNSAIRGYASEYLTSGW